PSTADSCISVGAFIVRNRWRDYLGEDHFIDWDVIGELAGFSSQGPRIDGLLKPNITAPGQRTISCRDSRNIRLGGTADYLIISNDGNEGLPADYIAMMGTSMSSPAAAGTAALILQTRPDCSSSELRDMIYRGARSDEYTGEVPNTSWGWGKIDFPGARSAPDDHGRYAIPLDPSLESIYPNPFNAGFKVGFSTARSGVVLLLLYDTLGRKIWSKSMNIDNPGVHYITLVDELRGMSSGTYMLSIRDAGGQTYRPVTLMK
ncbi:MAG TPA: T9SS type A sorting domain-containing protein, partial [Bacteroidetes bacterium]|nr:T9SS type A sorting domain-containing protein [Bacteroidota bacterium]